MIGHEGSPLHSNRYLAGGVRGRICLGTDRVCSYVTKLVWDLRMGRNHGICRFAGWHGDVVVDTESRCERQQASV